MFVQLAAWGTRNLPASAEYAARLEVLISGGPPAWAAFMDELRETHLGPQARRQPAPDGPTVAARMQAAYAAALAG